MAGDFTGCTAIIRKKSSSGSFKSNGGGGGAGTNGSEGQRSSSGSGQSKSNDSSSSCSGGGGKARRIIDNMNGAGKGGSAGVLVPVHHKDSLRTYKIVILGDGGVGKSGEYLMPCYIWKEVIK